MVMKVAGHDTRLVSASPAEREAAQGWLETFSQDDLTRYVQILLALYQDLQSSSHQRFRLEVGLLKLVHAGRLAPIEEVLGGLGKPAPAAATQRKDKTADETPAAPDPPSKPAADPPAAKPAGSFQQQLVDALEEAGNQTLVDAVKAGRVERDERVVTIDVPADWMPVAKIEMPVLEATVTAVIGAKADVRLIGSEDSSQADQPSGDSPPDAAAAKPVSEDELSSRAEADPAVQAFTERFEGRITKVVEMRENTP